MKMKLKSVIFILFLFFIYNCQSKFNTPDLFVNSPVNLKAYPTNQGIILKFYGNNREEGFKGYNVYVSKSPGIRYKNLNPVKNIYNSEPTLPYGFNGCYPDASTKSFITVKKDSYNSAISNYVKYYVTVTAVAIINNKTYESEHSNEVEVIPLKETNITLFNHTISGMTNDGLIFENNNLIITNAPDILISNWGGDLVFGLKNFEGVILPFFIVKSNSVYIQSLGYNKNVNELDNIPAFPQGYLGPETEIIIKNSYLYIIYKPSLNRYLRIYIKDAPANQNSETSDVNLKIICSY